MDGSADLVEQRDTVDLSGRSFLPLSSRRLHCSSGIRCYREAASQLQLSRFQPTRILAILFGYRQHFIHRAA